MKIFSKMMPILTVGMLLAGCASAPRSIGPPSDQMQNRDASVCFDGHRIHDIESIGPREVVVRLRGEPAYRVVLRDACPGIEGASALGFSSGPSRIVGTGSEGLPVYAESREPSGRVCAGGFSRLIAYPAFYRFDQPLAGCRIAHIEALRPR